MFNEVIIPRELEKILIKSALNLLNTVHSVLFQNDFQIMKLQSEKVTL